VTADPVIEAEATHFAMCLLMPTRLLQADIHRMGGVDIEDGRAIGELAKKYRVSPTLMAVRIGWLLCERSRSRPLMMERPNA
jgi:Zn-dependent peptidase ImmA (M78 family)